MKDALFLGEGYFSASTQKLGTLVKRTCKWGSLVPTQIFGRITRATNTVTLRTLRSSGWLGLRGKWRSPTNLAFAWLTPFLGLWAELGCSHVITRKVYSGDGAIGMEVTWTVNGSTLPIRTLPNIGASRWRSIRRDSLLNLTTITISSLSSWSVTPHAIVPGLADVCLVNAFVMKTWETSIRALLFLC